jgi:uncharacterized membrane protein YbaN (DUF454 family)
MDATDRTDAPPVAGTALSPRRRVAFAALGWVFFCLGVVGLLLPIVPTTPFMLLALWAFSNSSQRFHDWLYHHRVFGPPLQRWRRERTVPAWSKALALGSMCASFVYLAAFVRPGPWALVAAGAAIAAGATYIARIRTRPRD